MGINVDEVDYRQLQAMDAANSRTRMHDTAEPILQHFAFEHLPEHLRSVSQPFGELARDVVTNLPRNAERSTCLRKLLEAKDCAVRARVQKD